MPEPTHDVTTSARMTIVKPVRALADPATQIRGSHKELLGREEQS